MLHKLIRVSSAYLQYIEFMAKLDKRSNYTKMILSSPGYRIASVYMYWPAA